MISDIGKEEDLLSISCDLSARCANRVKFSKIETKLVTSIMYARISALDIIVFTRNIGFTT